MIVFQSAFAHRAHQASTPTHQQLFRINERGSINQGIMAADGPF